ncbi:Beta-barrel assembly machine subunit BamE [Paraperlucidibaca baekdonensis]|uniref:Outer membrane protein assembly factor BamE n=1 Tax=Paraperlucidibaca baekdonensis TaxID=748120 RepID=A0A3E0H8Q1_9GAMM|nr:outer membrane protein assembly factor BamE [Paraperlucidibaca baekdonensis]REH39860.1 Beta-barrel assembly machine subunit BamE [Paraperlucidibaca baekdonensis]
MQKKLLAIALIAAVLSSVGCKNVFRAYRIDVVQGQTITSEQADKIKIGMSPAQVRYVLGSPLITDTLNPTRWDYTYRFLPGTYATEAGLEKVPHRRLSVFFANGVVANIDREGKLPSTTTSLPNSKDGAVRTTESSLESQRPAE